MENRFIVCWRRTGDIEVEEIGRKRRRRGGGGGRGRRRRKRKSRKRRGKLEIGLSLPDNPDCPPPMPQLQDWGRGKTMMDSFSQALMVDEEHRRLVACWKYG